MVETVVKNEKEIQIMRDGGKILSKIFKGLKSIIKPNLDVWDLEEKFLELCKENNVLPSCKGYGRGEMPPFPTGLCISINNQSVHCFPKKGVTLKEGDIVSIDSVINFEGLNVDSAFCYPVGKVDKRAEKLIETTKKALYSAISKVKEGVKIGVISENLQKTAEKEGFNVLKDYAGHGIGYSMHEYPEILCYGSKHDGPKLRAGMTICIEALVCEGEEDVKNVSAWETEMSDGNRFCIFEHTVLVTKEGYEIITE